jgi:hypothetical protein
MVKIQETENQIVTDYEVFKERPADKTVLMPSIEKRQEVFNLAAELVAADAGFFGARNEENAKEAKVKKQQYPRSGRALLLLEQRVNEWSGSRAGENYE